MENFFKPFPKKAVASIKKKAPRGKASPNLDVPVATQWLLAVMPSSISLEDDQYQGRWHILCESGCCKSVAWRGRGFSHACD